MALNLQANPSVIIQVMNKIMPALAGIAPNDLQDALYQKFIDEDKRFVDYLETRSPGDSSGYPAPVSTLN